MLIKDSFAGMLREEIMSGRLQPGDLIVEGKWAAKHKVAQASVREAINILASEGFVQKDSGRTAHVTLLSEEDVRQIFELRAMLEGMAARLIMQNKPDLGDADQVLADMRSAAECHNERAFFERDLRFHLLICEKAGNHFLLEALKRVIVPLFAFYLMRVPAVADNPNRWRITQHWQILAALRSGDPVFAEQVIARQFQDFFVGNRDLLVRNGQPSGEAAGKATQG